MFQTVRSPHTRPHKAPNAITTHTASLSSQRDHHTHGLSGCIRIHYPRLVEPWLSMHTQRSPKSDLPSHSNAACCLLPFEIDGHTLRTHMRTHRTHPNQIDSLSRSSTARTPPTLKDRHGADSLPRRRRFGGAEARWPDASYCSGAPPQCATETQSLTSRTARSRPALPLPSCSRLGSGSFVAAPSRAYSKPRTTQRPRRTARRRYRPSRVLHASKGTRALLRHTDKADRDKDG
jgi:hypothetical protein